MDEAWKYYAKLKKLVPKDHILQDSVYMKCPGQKNTERQRVD